jgi:general secretion pathway protein D
MCWLCLALAGCGGNLGPDLENPQSVDLSARKPSPLVSRGESARPPTASRGKYELYQGTEQSLNDSSLDPPPGVVQADGKYTINVDRADIAEVAKLVLGETLGLNYIIDPRVQGTITLSSSRPLTSSEVLDAFEAALRLNGAGLVKTGSSTKIVALQELLEGEMGSADFNSEKTAPGYGVSAIPLRFVSVSNMMELMDSFIARSGSVRASNAGNLILVRGTSAERRALVDVVLSFDVDWMRSQSASIAILANSSPEEMVTKLQAVFAEDTAVSGKNAIKVIPLERLNGVIVIANSKEKVRRALNWVSRIDKPSDTDTNYYVYAVQNGNAQDLAKILTATFAESAAGPGATAEVAPDEPTVQISSPELGGTQDQSQAPAGAAGQAGKSDRQDLAVPEAAPQTPEGQPPPPLTSGVRITPNLTNNTIIIRASPREYRKILAMLRQIDAPAVQVLINTTIAEVALNDNLRYGVQAYFKDDDVSAGIFNGRSLVLRPSFPGLNFFLGSTNDPRLVLDALSAVTKVRIVSSPSVLVLENEVAVIKVGDQVPIKVQTLERDTGGSVDSFEYRDTGVILKVRPRVNTSGLVTMELGQELSAVTASTGTSTTEQENPTFTQRSITSKVSVYSSQTVVLGGLISGQDNRRRDSVPVVNKIPVIGDLFGKTENTSRRNELIVFITPQIIRNGEDASHASEELRAKMKLFKAN